MKRIEIVGSRSRQSGWTAPEILIGTGMIFVCIFALVVAVIPFDRYRDSRNAKRSTECYTLLNAVLLREVDDVATYWGESEAPIDTDPKTAQVIVRELDGATCAPKLATTPTCPGAERIGLKLSEDSWNCLTMLDDGRFNGIGLVNRYLLSIPIDPAGPGVSSVQYIQGLPIGNNNTGYYINRTDGDRLEVGACHPEMGELVREMR